MDIGLNLAKPTYYARPQFVDRRLHAGKLAVSGGTIGPNGWPIGPSKASTVYALDAQPTEYTVVITKGAASKVTITQPTGAIGGAKNITAAFDASGVAKITAAGLDGHGITVAIATTDAAETRWAIVATADYAAWLGDPLAFAPWWIAKLKNYRVFRAMDWMMTNADRASGYAEADPLNQFAPFASGLPVSLIVKLALQTGLRPWVDVGAYDDDDTVRSIMQRLEPCRAAGIKVHVEYSNEVWNTDFDAHTYAVSQDKALWWNAQTDAYTKAAAAYSAAAAAAKSKPTAPPAPDGNRWYGYRAAQVSKVIQASGWKIGKDFRTGIGCQTAQPGMADKVWAGVAMAGGIDADFTDWIATCYIWGTLVGDDAFTLPLVRSGDVGPALDNLRNGGGLDLVWLAATLAKHSAIALAHGLSLAVYEGNFHLMVLPHFATSNLVARGTTDVTQDDVAAYFAKVQTDPRAAGVFTAILDTAAAAGVTTFCIYNDQSTFGNNGNFGIFGTPAEQATAAWIAAHAPKVDLKALADAVAGVKATVADLEARIAAAIAA